MRTHYIYLKLKINIKLTLENEILLVYSLSYVLNKSNRLEEKKKISDISKKKTSREMFLEYEKKNDKTVQRFIFIITQFARKYTIYGNIKINSFTKIKSKSIRLAGDTAATALNVSKLKHFY